MLLEQAHGRHHEETAVKATDILRNEHETILDVLAALESITRPSTLGGGFDRRSANWTSPPDCARDLARIGGAVPGHPSAHVAAAARGARDRNAWSESSAPEGGPEATRTERAAS